jgi:hypothetical protein
MNDTVSPGVPLVPFAERIPMDKSYNPSSTSHGAYGSEFQEQYLENFSPGAERMSNDQYS